MILLGLLRLSCYYPNMITISKFDHRVITLGWDVDPVQSALRSGTIDLQQLFSGAYYLHNLGVILQVSKEK